jgi:hypothetical protein
MAKLANTLISMGLPEGIFSIMQGYLQYGDVFRVEGYDWYNSVAQCVLFSLIYSFWA